MKKSELRHLIREMIREEFSPRTYRRKNQFIKEQRGSTPDIGQYIQYLHQFQNQIEGQGAPTNLEDDLSAAITALKGEDPNKPIHQAERGLIAFLLRLLRGFVDWLIILEEEMMGQMRV